MGRRSDPSVLDGCYASYTSSVLLRKPPSPTGEGLLPFTLSIMVGKFAQGFFIAKVSDPRRWSVVLGF